MIIIKQASELLACINKQKGRQQKIGFVPTMGALHRGHLTLIEQAKKKTGFAVCSIFVNPTQFNNQGDFDKYPVTLDKDIHLLEATGTDILFLPSVKEMYPHGTNNLEQYELGYLETILEGKYRPGHFQGVCQAMSRLLTMVAPDALYMGRKDYQQCMIVKHLLEVMGMPVQFITVPTVREPDGLAMSSRNMRLSPADRAKAATIYQSLCFIKESLHKDDWPLIEQQAIAMLTAAGFEVDYVVLANAQTLKPVNSKYDHHVLAVLVAAYLNGVRLIDNMIVME